MPKNALNQKRNNFLLYETSQPNLNPKKMKFVIIHTPTKGGLFQWSIPDKMTLAEGVTQ